VALYYNKKNFYLIILSIPAIFAFFIALIPTLKYQWPLSWDIYYHVHMAKLYIQHGITFWDPLTIAPGGRPIYYPPLFHYLLASLSVSTGLDPFKIARFLQPIFAMFIVLSFSYVTYKLYNLFVGVSAGFFIMLPALFFQRFMLPIPEAMSLIIFPLSLYFYYLSIKKQNFRFSAISGILSGVILLTHALSAICLFLVASLYPVVLKLSRRKVEFTHFLVFLGVTFLVSSIWWLPILLKYGYVFKFPATSMISISRYPEIFGSISLILALIGGFLAFKKRLNQDILILSWFLSLIILSNVYFFDIPILSDRVLTFAVFPLALLAGLGIQGIKEIFPDKKLFYIFFSIIIMVAVFSGISIANTVNMGVTASELDIAKWFHIHGDKEKVVVTSDYRIDPIIVSIARQPVAIGGYAPGSLNSIDVNKYVQGNFNESDIDKDHVGYIVLNLNIKTPTHTKIVYQNNEYKICMVENV